MSLPTQALVQRIEHLATPILESIVENEGVEIGLGLAQRAGGTFSRTVERGSRRIMHALNLPAASDINRILTQVASLERTVRALDNRVNDVLAEQQR
ncbi:hypothetical protein [Gordonia rhizosphera]|uniref:Uncharacterized protein n=1 Tax=Gordonia rhizosphera NBRC 16068 TaxID=1108045 RepID=K6WVY9_9ACTN|nr:hypothetical protein [Gordonia rhizosphera]GAB90714.1 hypothetical protein GORHZ_115_00700 [Gordonia rhizosphera NBRC 16068]